MESAVYPLFADLLEYPTPALGGQVSACIKLLKLQQPETVERLLAFQSGLCERSLAQMEELYTSTFDMQPVCYPYVGFHLFGESYKRGAFMAKLVEGYRQHGFAAGNDLPDHLPVILRFLALESAELGNDFSNALLFEGLIPALEKMIRSLEGQPNHPYGALLSALWIFLQNVTKREKSHA